MKIKFNVGATTTYEAPDAARGGTQHKITAAPDSSTIPAGSDISIYKNVKYDSKTYTLNVNPTTIQITGEQRLPNGDYEFDTVTKSLTSAGQAARTGTQQTATSSSTGLPEPKDINIGQVTQGLDALIGGVSDALRASFPEDTEIDSTEEGLVYFKPKFSSPIVPVDTNDEDYPDPGPTRKVIEALNDGDNNEPSIADMIDTIATENTDFASFLVNGKRGVLNADLTLLYDNYGLMIDFLKVDQSLIDAKIDAIAAGEDSPGTTTATTDWAGNVSAAREQIVAALNKALDKMQDVTGISTTDFAKDKKYYKEIAGEIKKIKDSKDITPRNPKNLDDSIPKPSINPFSTGEPLNVAAHKALKTAINGQLKDELEKSEYKDAASLLNAGAKGAPKLVGDALSLYTDCMEFAEYLGVKEGFEKAAAGLSLGAEEDAEDADNSADATGALKTGAESILSRGAEAVGAVVGAVKAAGSGSEIGAPEAPQPDQVAFYVKITRANKSTPAKLKISAPSLGRDDGETEFNYQIPPGSFDKLVPVYITERNQDFYKNAGEAPISIEVEAVPASGGDAIKKSEQRVVPYPRKRGLKADVIPFQFDASLGTVTGPGLQADKGYGGAKNFTDKSGEVQEISWAAAGGVKYNLVNVDVAAEGRTYTFNFKTRPFLVPVRIKTKKPNESKQQQLNEATAVPHWIFIDPNRARRGKGGSDGGGGDDATAGGEAYNIAIRSIQISTDAKWISLPVPNSDWDEGSFKISIAGGKGADLGGIPEGIKQAICADDLSDAKLGGLMGMKAELRKALYDTLFRQSEAYMRLGITCWGDSQRVSGPGALTVREPTTSVRMTT